jgi:hypothetical protein
MLYKKIIFLFFILINCSLRKNFGNPVFRISYNGNDAAVSPYNNNLTDLHLETALRPNGELGRISEDIVSLDLSTCERVRIIPDLSLLKNLSKLDISGCTSVVGVLGLSESLTELHLDNLNLIPYSVSTREVYEFVVNRELGLVGREPRLFMPQLPRSLELLYMHSCTGIEYYPELSALRLLKILDLSDSDIKRLPDLSELRSLVLFNLKGTVVVTGIDESIVENAAWLVERIYVKRLLEALNEQATDRQLEANVRRRRSYAGPSSASFTVPVVKCKRRA